MSRLFLIFALVFASTGARLPQAIDGRRMVEDVRYLSSPQFQGRFSGTPELDRAADHIAKTFKKLGLKTPFVEAGQKLSYMQKFIVNTESKLGAKNTLKVGNETYNVAKDFLPRVFSSSGSVNAGLVFAGYGITASEYHYDDYARLDAKGKVVVIIRYEPQDLNDKSAFDGKNRTRHASLESKVVNAKLHGAAAVILVNNATIYPDEADKLEAFGNQAGSTDLGIPAIQVRADVAQKWFDSTGHDLKGIIKAIDQTLEPQSFRFADSMNTSMHIEVDRVMRPTHNVAAFLPGQTEEYIVIGAHYDHLGLGRQFSMAPSEVPKIHPGADDNASGTAAVMELARYFAAGPKPKRGILFAAFSGEEIGLLGSAHLVQNMPYPIANCAAMINLDMVGRMKDGKFYVAGAATGSTFRQIVDHAVKIEPGLRPEVSDNLGVGGSDHTSFSSKQVPAIFFFTGLHSDYHRPSDTWEKFDANHYAKLIRVVASAANEVANAEERPQFRKVDAPMVSSGGGGGNSGYGPYFGSVPDFADVPNGVKFSDVRSGSPAEKAGLKGGDILIEFDGKPVKNLQDYTYLLRGKKPGDEIEVKVLRGSQTVSAKVTLSVRR